MTYFSAFSGIEAASVAWRDLNFQAVGFSEIDPFCCAVLEHRFSAIKNYGNINNFKEWKIERSVDVMVGGSPCQSYSFAGNRRGAEDDRGRLMFTYGNLVNYFRPRWIVWENVPGVLSSCEGKDFAEFLGMLDGYGYGLAWRVLDAQYFGVPQRRRRVFVVGYLGDVRRSVSVLIDAQGGCRDTAQGETKREKSAPGAGGGVGATVYNVHQHDSRITKSDGVIDAVTSVWGTGGNNTPLCLMDQGGGVMQIEYGKTGTLRANEHQHNPIIFNRASISSYKPDTQAATLLADYHDHRMINILYDTCGLLRRIMPVEAERLQGFPDNWTLVPYRGKAAENCPDGPRYKAVGNSMAVPVMRWLGRRIQFVEELFKDDI